jgi:hypothetical protein
MRYFKAMNGDTELGFFNTLAEAVAECEWCDDAHGEDHPIEDAEITEFESKVIANVDNEKEIRVAWSLSEIIETYDGEEIEEFNN